MPRVLSAVFVISLLIVQTTEAKLIDPCASSASTAGGVLLVCPHGDGPTLADIGAVVDVTVMINNGGTIEPYPAFAMLPQDIWIEPGGNYGYPSLCHGSYCVDADGYLDENGHTTISGSIAAGGYSEDPVYVFAVGQAIQLGEGCNNPIPLVLVSPDINGDLVVDIGDFAMFAEAIHGDYNPRMDFNGDQVLNAGDLGLFAFHYFHSCETNQ